VFPGIENRGGSFKGISKGSVLGGTESTKCEAYPYNHKLNSTSDI